MWIEIIPSEYTHSKYLEGTSEKRMRHFMRAHKFGHKAITRLEINSLSYLNSVICELLLEYKIVKIINCRIKRCCRHCI